MCLLLLPHSLCPHWGTHTTACIHTTGNTCKLHLPACVFYSYLTLCALTGGLTQLPVFTLLETLVSYISLLVKQGDVTYKCFKLCEYSQLCESPSEGTESEVGVEDTSREM